MPQFKALILSAGHHPYDPGAISMAHAEHSIVTQINWYTLGYLSSTTIHIVPATSLRAKVEWIKAVAIADDDPSQYLLIETHLNSFHDKRVRGMEMLHLPDLDDDGELSAAGRASDHILYSLSELFADRGRKMRDDLYLLNQAPCPAIISELGFLSNKDDRNLLVSPPHQDRIAELYAQGIMAAMRKVR